MANTHGLTENPQTLQRLSSTEPARQHINPDGSVAMEQSASTSSVSSSIASFFTSSSATSIQSSAFMPTTPKLPLQTIDPFRNLFRDNSEGCNTDNGIAHFGKDLNVPAKMSIAQKPLDIRSLMSPPDAEKINSFSNTGASASSGAITTFCPALSASQAQARTVGNGPQADEHGQISPPLSLQGNEEAEPENTGFREDPILFPDTASPLHNRPLFADNTATIISNHIASRSPSLFRQVSPPRGEDYELVVRMRSQVMQRFNADRRGWLKQQREQLLADKKAAAERAQRLRLPAPVPRPVFSQPVARNLTPRTPKEQTIIQPAQGSSSRHDQLSISRPVHDSASRVAKRANRAPARIAPQVNGIVRHGSGSNQNTARVPGSSPEPRIRTSAPNREDKDFNSVEDYTPPLSTLPENAQCMKADWKSTPLDLTNDPLRHLLHPAELVLAAGLRLDCATYLTSKRRIFVRRLQCERHPKKEFRKTDAQQACNIDVNKASKLWTAYDKVGWLDRKYIEQYI